MNQTDEYKNCSLCPRNCHVDRHSRRGYCQCTDKLMAARAALHHWEEPCISGTKGSGTIFSQAVHSAAAFAKIIP